MPARGGWRTAGGKNAGKCGNSKAHSHATYSTSGGGWRYSRMLTPAGDTGVGTAAAVGLPMTDLRPSAVTEMKLPLLLATRAMLRLIEVSRGAVGRG